MNASISDPFLLASYSLPSLVGRAPAISSASKASHVLLDSQYASTSDKTNHFVSLAVQGDGVHVLDLPTAHPATSHTLGPNTRFACPPASRTSKRNGVQTCTTYAVIESSPDVDDDHRGRTVWWWEESLSGGVMTADAQRKRKSAVVSHRVAHICAPEDAPEHLLLVRPDGRISIADADLNVHSSTDAEGDKTTTAIRHFVFPGQACTFIPNQPDGIVCSSVLQRGTSVVVEVSTVDVDGQIHLLGSCTIAENPDIIDASVSFTGCLTLMNRVGVWSSYSLSATPTTVNASPLCSPVPLHFLSFFSSAGHTTLHCSEISILALTSSHVLLASMPYNQSEIVLLIWDMQYGIVLAEHRFPCPSHLHHGQQRGVAMELVASGSPDQALLVLHPAVSKHDHARAASVLVVPYVVPKTSTIANALGRAAASQQWIRTEGESRKRHTAPTRNFSGVTPLQERALKAMFAAQHSGDLAEVQKQWKDYLKAVPNPSVQPALGHLFVKHVLDLVFLVPTSGKDGAAQANASAPYARDTVKYLLERKAVSDAMVDGGLIPALMARKDWGNAVLALSAVSDLPESAVMSLLAQVVAQHRRQSAPDAMQVDAVSALPALPSFLALCVNYAASPGPLRVALRKYLPDAEDVVCVLEILDDWLERWSAEEVQLVPEGVTKDENGAYIAVLPKEKPLEIPPLDKVLAFISAILDSSFLSLLSHQPAHPLLRALFARLEPELAFASELQALKGPLQAFLSTPRRADRQRKPDTPAEQIKWKRAQAEEREMNVGIYQVETLWL